MINTRLLTKLVILITLCSCLSVMAQSTLVKQVSIQDFGEPNLSNLQEKLKNVKARVAPPDSVLRIIQLGDSHTAGDFLTGELRSKLQQQFGSAGIGWVYPMPVYGQRNALINYNNFNWLLTSSRSTKATDYPLGGFIATPSSTGAKLTLTYNGTEKPNLWNATFLIKQENSTAPLRIVDGMNYETVLQPQNTKDWQYVSTYVMFPFTIIADKPDAVKLGGIWLEKNGEPGITVSPVGLNGARQTIWSKWRPDWLSDLAKTQSDLVVIAYGTNEAFETNLNIANYKKLLKRNIQEVRAALPKSTILILSVPDAMVRNKINSANSCQAKQPPSLTAIKNAQLEVAKEMHTLYWSWQEAMGGPCAMENWSKQGLAAKDFVHLTAPGYQQSANSLYNALMNLISQEQKLSKAF